MIGLPVLVIAMSDIDLRVVEATKGVAFVGAAANRGRTDEQHRCISMVAQRRRDVGVEEGRRVEIEFVGVDSGCSQSWTVYQGHRECSKEA